MRVRDIMKPRIYTCPGSASLGDAARIMAEHACGILPIVEPKSHRLLGVITDRDICLGALAGQERLDAIPVRSAFSWRLVTCREDDDILTVCRAMSENGVRRLPVTDRRGILVGLVSLDDLAGLACRTMSDEGVILRDVVTRTLAAIGEAIARHQGPMTTEVATVEE
ncbi:MAG: CBS domain-containing protein [Planctomycetes bacterium]|nr:CBS domain-containing protein [Planctomycetota bacterium]